VKLRVHLRNWPKHCIIALRLRVAWILRRELAVDAEAFLQGR
jgi:hypothetical protein